MKKRNLWVYLLFGVYPISLFDLANSELNQLIQVLILSIIASLLLVAAKGFQVLNVISIFIKGVSEKTNGFNHGMNRVSDAYFSTQLTVLVFPEILFQSPLLPFSKEHLDEKSIEHTFFSPLKNPVIPCLICHNHV